MKYISFAILALVSQVAAPAISVAQYTDQIQYICADEHINARAETEKFYWLGTDHGLYCIQKKKGKVYHMTTKNSLFLSDTITSIATKPDGEVYIGTHNGIIRYDNYSFLLITDENSRLKSNKITSLVCTGGAEVFAGTFDGGITIFSGVRSRTFTAGNTPLASNHIISFEKFGKDSVVALLENNVKVAIRDRRFTLLNNPGK